MLLNFDDDGHPLTGIGDQLLDFEHVLRVPHKAEGHPIHPLIQAKEQIFAVFIRQRLNRQIDTREVNPFIVRQHAAHHDTAVQLILLFVDRFHFHLDLTVVEQNGSTIGHFLGQRFVGNRADALGAR